MNERIKRLRKALGLTQQEFSRRIGTTANVLTNYETGRRNPSSSVINNICKTFSVHESWLRTGEGEMFYSISEDEELTKYVSELGMSDRDSELVKRIMRSYLKLDERGKRALENLIESFLPDNPAPEPEKDQQAIWEAEARAEAEEYYREILAEKKAEAESSALQSDGGPLMGA